MLTSIAWADLSRTERRAIARLANDGERIGVELGTVERGLYPAILALHDKGLATARLGWRGTVWVSLTVTGRRVRDLRPRGG